MSASPAPPRFRSAFLFLALCSTACQSAPDDLREWRPGDHTNSGETGAMKKGQVTGEATANAAGLDQVILSTWQNNCVSCHGRIGTGDGPQAPLYQPRDLTDPAFQSSVSDEQLLVSIQNGKGKMPGFALPEATARGLVRLIRLLSRSDGRAASSSSAAPAASATHSNVTGAASPDRSRPATETSGIGSGAPGPGKRKSASGPSVTPGPTSE